MATTLRTAMIGIAILGFTACGGGGGGGAGSPGGTDAPGPATASLSRAADCDELLTRLREDARAKIAVQADGLRQGGWAYVNDVPSPGGSATPMAMPTSSPTTGAPPPNVTDTNTQVPGVDEADVVEIDGTRIFLLRGQRVLVLSAVPPEASALLEEIRVEGWPIGMFVAGGRALVVSSVSDSGALGGDSACGGIGAPFPGFASSFAPCPSSFVKLTLLDVSGTPARIVRELYVEGDYVAARRHGDRARVIVQRTWGAPGALVPPWHFVWEEGTPPNEAELIARVDDWERRALAVIDASTLADWLPTERERVHGTLIEHPLTCEQVAIPPPGEAPSGATLVVGFALGSDDGPIADTLLLGGTSQIYANQDTLVLAQPEWQTVPFEGAQARTALHVFGLAADALGPTYRGSGFVPGTLSSQFGLDVAGDVVRAATSVVPASGDRPNATRVTTAHVVDGELVRLGASEDLAPGEFLRGVRFLGDRAYLVTFLQVDPLFVVDLADPAHPRLLGELTLPGFSEYLHPLDPDHLLTIGRAADAGGRAEGVALRLFDVADPTAPRQTAEYRLPSDAWTPAEYDHLAFTFDAGRGLLALPVTASVIANGFPVQHGTLQIIAVDAATGSIHLDGVVDHGTPLFGPCAPPYGWEFCPSYDLMERGLFIGDDVYSISSIQMQVHALDDLGTRIAAVPLP